MSQNKPQSPIVSGDRFGGYTVQSLIGRGRKSEVHRAFSPDVKREVAIKIYRTDLPQTPERAARFRQEAQAVSALKHPNIMRLYDSGYEAGKYYLVMELVEGTHLRDIISTHPLGLERDETLRIFGQLASAIASAHDQNVVHGNIKPDNVLVDKSRRPVLTDFNIPCLWEPPDSNSASAATYLAPEQAAEPKATPQSDIYALGILLYEMITGDIPFKGDTFESVMAQHQNAAPPSPSLTHVNVDPRVEQTIMKALSKNPAERFGSAREMISSLQSKEALKQFETVTLTRDSLPKAQRSRSDLVRFQRSRIDGADEPARLTSLVRHPSPELILGVVAVVIIVAVVLTALLR